jgi:hypothetical protein
LLEEKDVPGEEQARCPDNISANFDGFHFFLFNNSNSLPLVRQRVYNRLVAVLWSQVTPGASEFQLMPRLIERIKEFGR